MLTHGPMIKWLLFGAWISLMFPVLDPDRAPSGFKKNPKGL
jgi:hypothetical protein